MSQVINPKIIILSEEDKKFAKDLSEEFKIQLDTIESCIVELFDYANFAFKSDNAISLIDYKAKLSSLEDQLLLFLSRCVLADIYYKFELNFFNKCLIAGRLLMHYKLDKYSRIKTSLEFDNYPTEARNYKYYIYNRMKSRFIKIKNQKRTLR